MKLYHALRRLSRVLAVGAVCSTAALVSADYPVYSLRFGVSDFDQVWDGLYEVNFGRYHCVPTSYANIFKYLADNGLDSMSWVPSTSDPNFRVLLELELLLLGSGMGTEFDEEEGGTQGTGSLEAFEYAIHHLATRAPNILMVNVFLGPETEWGTGAIQKAVASGSIVRLGYGRYKDISLSGGSNPIWQRDGGHSVTLVGYDYRNSNDKWIMVNDPSTGENEGTITQSPMMYDFKAVNNLTLNTTEYENIAHARYTTFGGTELIPQRNMIDSMHQILPVYAGWEDTWVAESGFMPQSSSLLSALGNNWDGRYRGDGSVRVVIPWQPTEQRGVIPSEFSFRPRENMIDWTLATGEMSAYYLTHLGRVFRVDLITGEHKLLHVIKGAKQLLEGGSTLDLYVLASDGATDKIVKLERGSNQMSSMNLPGRAVAMDYDPATGGPAVLDADLHRVHSFTEDLERLTTTDIPPIQSGLGKVIFKIDHRTGEFLSARQGSFDLDFFDRNSTRGSYSQHLPRLVSGITNLSPTENGLVAVQDGRTLLTFERDGTERVTQLTGVQANGEFEIVKTFMAAKPWKMVGRGWRNIWPVTD